MRKGLEYLEEALAIAKEMGWIYSEKFHLGNIATAYEQLGYTRKSIEYNEQALDIAKKVGDKQGEGHIL